MKEIKTVALVGLGAIGAYFADRLQPVLGDDLRVIAGGARAERIRREGLVINGKQEYYHVVEPGEGEPADLVIFDPKAEYEIDKETFCSKGKNTPFDGRKVKGKVRCTISDGRVVYQEA